MTTSPSPDVPVVPAVDLPALAAPWYIHPVDAPGAWHRLLTGATSVSFAIVNVDNGPGKLGDPYYAPLLKEQSQTPLIGYVTVEHGRRPWAEVIADATAWQERYNISNIFLDCVPTQPKEGEWTIEWIDKLRANGAGYVVCNPGALPHVDLLHAANVTCVSECSWETYQKCSPPRSEFAVPNSRLWHMVHGCPDDRFDEARRLASTRQVGVFWATPGTLPNPWQTLPKDVL